MNDKVKKSLAGLYLAIMLLGILIPTFGLEGLSATYRTRHGLAEIEEGQMDCKMLPTEKEHVVYLNGRWELYPGQWIVSEPALPVRAAPELIKVPTDWNRQAKGVSFLPDFGYGSYRLVLTNCPSDMEYICYLPQIRGAYRVFMNGRLVAYSGQMSKQPQETVYSSQTVKNNIGRNMAGTTEIVIELCSDYFPVLSSVPILIEQDYDHLRTSRLGIWSGMYIGILLVLILGYGLFGMISRRISYSIPLTGVWFILFLLVVSRGEGANSADLVLPFLEPVRRRVFLLVLLELFPYLSFLSVYQLLGRLVEREKMVVATAAFLICLFGCNVMVHGSLANYFPLFFVIGFVPVLLTFHTLFTEILAGREYAFGVGLSFVALWSGVLAEGYHFLGIFIYPVSMYLPTCSLICISLLLGIYIHKSVKAQRMVETTQKKLLEMSLVELKLKDTELALMLSQIKPHFLYNALLAIYELNRENSAETGNAILTFAQYLRTNMRSVGSKKPIPFAEELVHIKNYAAIEQLRFRERLRIHYEIGCEYFCVPPLTIQPLVENAIKHGICKRIAGGNVWLRTMETADEYVLVIEDDGVGFDPEVKAQQKTDSMGLENVRNRLEHIVHARLEIVSSLDHGTTVTIRIPKSREGDSDVDDSDCG